MQEPQKKFEVSPWSFQMAPQFLGPLTFQCIELQPIGRSGQDAQALQGHLHRQHSRWCWSVFSGFVLSQSGCSGNRLLVSCLDHMFFRQFLRSAQPRASSCLLLTWDLEVQELRVSSSGGLGGGQVLPRVLCACRALFPLLSDCSFPVFLHVHG